ncbi:MAG TPA: hypothetical protein VF618_28565 [Thermoanaerobaculia bacterium]
MQFQQVVRTFRDFFEAQQIRYAVVGGLAIHAWGRSRTTQDIDFLVDGLQQPRVVAFVESLGYETLFVSEGFSNHLHASKDFGKVDVLYVYGRTADEMFAEAVQTLEVAGVQVPVPRAEHLVAMKVAAMKDAPRRVLIDAPDVEYLMSLPGLDEAQIRNYFERAGLLPLYDGIRRQQKRP